MESHTDDKHEKTYKIFVNGIEKDVNHDVLTFEEIVVLAEGEPKPLTIYSVTFSHGKDPKEGELVAGQSVTVKNNTEFDVDDTGRS
jgi:hypothetical protein